ncbi:hypothetical protein DXT91_16570 [Agrobacterium tumefaciens]|uniref:hypothetical protein n=1 Tax=Agrobacterium tumefaciens TaxID=358 RepID=UPI0012B959A7|nr:hypothetical protein [Agrobacterium tumefaciens]MQB05730.1 hypothetical protein [Agrobacterium tumefaciens]
MRLKLFAVGVSALSAGCNIHPLPEDISKGDTTYQIVAKVRCEARDAIRRKAILYLKSSDVENTRAIGASLERGVRRFDSVKYSELDPSTRGDFTTYEGTAIAYEFTLDITEKNDNSVSLDFLNPFSNGKRTLGVGAGIERQRQNSRNFRVADNFGDLARELPDSYCSVRVKTSNHIYPLLGRVGLAEAIDTFIDLNQSGNIAAKEGGTVKQMADTIDFQTTLKGSASPSIELTPVTSGVGLSTASLENSVSRIDKHKLVFALSLPPSKSAGGKSAPVSPKTTAKSLAIQELDRQENRDLTNTLRTLENRVDQLQ